MAKSKNKRPNNISLKKDKDAKREGGKSEKEADRVSVEQVCQEEAERFLLEAHVSYRNLVSAGMGPGNFENYLEQFLSGYKDVAELSKDEEYYGEPKIEGPEVVRLHKEQPITPDLSKRKR